MKIKKYLLNSIFYFSIILFIVSVSLYWTNTKKPVRAQGSMGGRILSVVDYPALCVPVPCSCLSYMAVIMPAGGNPDPTYCFSYSPPLIPNFGLPITPFSVGMQIIGFFTTSKPVATSINWGTSPP